MKIERQIIFIIKSIKINHIIIFIFINLACFYLSSNTIKKTTSIKNQLTLNVQVPQYSHLEVGSFTEILGTRNIFYELKKLDKNKIFIEECKINPVEKDRHISYSPEQDNRSVIDGDLQLNIKIIHPEIIALNDCADAIIKIINSLFNTNKNKLYNKLNEKLEVIKRRELELDKATQKFVTEVKNKYDNLDESIEAQVYLNNFINNMIFENLKESYTRNIETDLEIEMKRNSNLEIKFFKSVEEFTLLNNHHNIKLLVINLFISSLLIIFFVFSLRKKI
jgi:hypothetical protein